MNFFFSKLKIDEASNPMEEKKERNYRTMKRVVLFLRCMLNANPTQKEKNHGWK